MRNASFCRRRREESLISLLWKNLSENAECGRPRRQQLAGKMAGGFA